ncbi:MAG: DUF2846 domain-containing protein [Spirochaetaceae bacterium]|jgi:hypothetical protein|nr:DUF2846 domain-containing protein [Spirochaetaceae bacterium]
MKRIVAAAVFLFTLSALSLAGAESVRIAAADIIEVGAEKPGGAVVNLSAGDSAIVLLEKDTRFLSGIEFEITAPSSWISHHGTLAAAFYCGLDKMPSGYASDIQVKELRYEPLPNKIQSVYQIPIKHGAALKTNPYVSVIRDTVLPDDFPVLFRIVPVNAAPGKEVESMEFRLNVKPLFSDEGAVQIHFRYPEHLPGRPVAVLIDGKVIENPQMERLIKEGEHQLTVLSADYRNQNRRFVAERGKSLSVTLALQDLTPQMIFEAPANARIFLDEKLIHNTYGALAVEAGKHDIKIQVSDYSIIRSINVQKGKTYRISFTVDMAISEHE